MAANTIGQIDAITSRKATELGKLVAQGLLSREECLPPLIEAARSRGNTCHISGLQAGLSWRVMDSASHWRRQIDAVHRAIRRVVRDIYDIQPAAVITQSASEINASYQEPLLPPQVEAAVAWEMEREREKRHRRR